MAKVKIFAPTYHRHKTFERSINSLLQQTFIDWVCEIHNDDPEDDFPTKYIKSLNDNRFIVINHKSNFGPVKTFNLMFDLTECNYICLLEDDNWWGEYFLSTMVEQMDLNHICGIGFSDINLWQEKVNGKWEKFDNTLWTNSYPVSNLIYFPQFRNIYNYYHSSCSIIIRNSSDLNRLKVPENIRFDFIEPIRERAFPHPILFVDQPLANFALTIGTSRPNNLNGIYEHYLLLIDSFFQNVPLTDQWAKELWDDVRKSPQKTFNKLIYTGLFCKTSRGLLKYAKLSEWIYFVLYNIKRPSIFFNCLKAKKNMPNFGNILWRIPGIAFWR